MIEFRKIFLIIFTVQVSVNCYSQQIANEKIKFDDVLKIIEENSDSTASAIKDKIFKNPQLFNSVWQKALQLTVKGKFDYLRDLNLQFKTFEANDSNKVSLGFSYDWDFSFAKQHETPVKSSELDFKLNAQGNVAFNKRINPADFLSTRFVFSRKSFGGGFVNKAPKELKDSLIAIKMRLADLDDEEVKQSPLWGELINHFKPLNRYYFDLNVSGGMESNQDFSLKQWMYGAQVMFSVKSYSDDNPLSQLNFLDYPFALIRKLTGTDDHITPYGASFPVFMAGIDMVKPNKDPLRKQLVGNLNAFPRFRFEAGFRTLLAQILDNTIFFNANFRIYKELDAPVIIKNAKLGHYVFFTSSLTSNKGLFVSYSNGKLPFDAQANAIYEIGFNYKL